MLDAFAGSGALAFEALSRGADHAVLVERDRRTLGTLRGNVAKLGLEARTTVLGDDVARVTSRLDSLGGPFDLLFFDPPYASVASVAGILDTLREVIAPDAGIVLEHDANDAPSPPSWCAPLASYRYGRVALELWSAPAAAAPER